MAMSSISKASSVVPLVPRATIIQVPRNASPAGSGVGVTKAFAGAPSHWLETDWITP